jgi:hypothetical protein
MKTVKILQVMGIMIFFMTLNVVPIYARSGINHSGNRITCCSTKDGTCCVVQPAVADEARTGKADYQQKLALLEEKIRHAMDDLDAASANSNRNGKIEKSLQQKVEMLEKEYWQLKMVK